MTAGTSDLPGKSRLHSLSISFGLFYAGLMILPGAHLIYLGIWLDWRGLNAQDIAAIGSVPILVRVLISPAIGFWADRTGKHRQIMIWLSIATIIGAVATAFARSFWAVLAWHTLVAVAWSTLMALGETLTMAAARQSSTPQDTIDYGRARLWGSISFIIAGGIAGVIGSRMGPGSAMIIAVVGAILTLGAILRLPAMAIATDGMRKRLSLLHAFELMRAPIFLLFLLAAGLNNAAHAMLYTFGTLHWQTLGYPPSMGSLFWVVSIIVEVWMFAQTARLNRRFSPLILIGLGAAGGVVRWLAMGFDPPFAVLLCLQMLHGLTYTATHIGAMQILNRLVAPEMAATAQTMYGTIALGLLMAIAVRLSGSAYATFGSAAYWIMALLSAAALAATLVLIARIGTDLPNEPILGRLT